MMITRCWFLLLAGLGLCVAQPAARGADARFGVRDGDGRLGITCDGQPVATYVYRDPGILRPYFADVHAPRGLKVTRNHPPVAGVDAADHDTMHPGLWLAFGDINGQDLWRNKARIEHVRFTEPPRARGGSLAFTAENRLRAADGRTLGTQRSEVILTLVPHGYLLVWQADFLPADEPLVFGDQEEMGLGVRVATRISEKGGGVLVASTGARTAKATWGQSFEWCDYSGELDGWRAGVALMPDPENFRPSWFHNRDYGLMVANPFGRKAMNQGETSRVVVEPGDRLRLRFGVYLHATPKDGDADIAGVHRRFLAARAGGVPD